MTKGKKTVKCPECGEVFPDFRVRQFHIDKHIIDKMIKEPKKQGEE